MKEQAKVSLGTRLVRTCLISQLILLNHLIRKLAICLVIGCLSDQSSGFAMLQELVHDTSCNH